MDVQLEFNLKDETNLEIKIGYLEKQLQEMHESMGKVRRKLFSELGVLTKLCFSLQIENQELQKSLKEIKNEKTEWVYGEKDCLFNVREYKKAVS